MQLVGERATPNTRRRDRTTRAAQHVDERHVRLHQVGQYMSFVQGLTNDSSSTRRTDSRSRSGRPCASRSTARPGLCPRACPPARSRPPASLMTVALRAASRCGLVRGCSVLGGHGGPAPTLIASPRFCRAPAPHPTGGCTQRVHGMRRHRGAGATLPPRPDQPPRATVVPAARRRNRQAARSSPPETRLGCGRLDTVADDRRDPACRCTVIGPASLPDSTKGPLSGTRSTA